MSKRKSKVKWSQSVEDFVLEKMVEEGLQPNRIFQKYADRLPDIRTHSRKRLTNPDYDDKINVAYKIFLEECMSEYNELSSMSPVEAYLHRGKCQDRDEVDFKDAAAFHRERLGALKTQINTYNAILGKQRRSELEIEVKGGVQNKVEFVLPDFLQKGLTFDSE